MLGNDGSRRRAAAVWVARQRVIMIPCLRSATRCPDRSGSRRRSQPYHALGLIGRPRSRPASSRSHDLQRPVPNFMRLRIGGRRGVQNGDTGADDVPHPVVRRIRQAPSQRVVAPLASGP